MAVFLPKKSGSYKLDQQLNPIFPLFDCKTQWLHDLPIVLQMNISSSENTTPKRSGGNFNPISQPEFSTNQDE